MLDTVRKCKCVVRACAKTEVITAWYDQGENEEEGYMRSEKNTPAEWPDERKVCGTRKNSRRQDRVAEIEKSWKSYASFSADCPVVEEEEEE